MKENLIPDLDAKEEEAHDDKSPKKKRKLSQREKDIIKLTYLSN